MALTQISTDGIKNGTITGSDLATDFITTGDFTFTGDTSVIRFDKSDDALEFQDNMKATFGNSGDLAIFHNGTYSRIEDVGTGHFELTTNGTSIDINKGTTEYMARFFTDGAVELYHDNVKRIETASAGANIVGNLDVINGHVYINDNYKVNVGTSSDLQIYHVAGANSYVQNFANNLYLSSTNSVQIVTTASDSSAQEISAKFFRNGAVELYDDGDKKLATHSGGVSVLGNLSLTNADSYELRLGAGSDLKLLHNGTDSKITNTTGNLIITQSDGIIRLDPKTNQNGILIRPGGATELYFNNSLRLLTTANGVTLDHNLLLDNATNAGRDVKWDPSNDQLIWNDSTKACFGDSADLQIFHDGHSIIKNTHSSAAFLISSHATHIVNAAVSENIAKFIEGTGGVELYHSNSKKFETTSTGCFVVGSLGVNPPSTGNLNVNKEGTGILISLQTTGTTRGSITSNGSTVAFNTSVSDRSMKKNFENWTENTLALFKNINPQKFNFLDQEDGTKKEKGYIAQDMFDSFPEAYQKNDDDKYVFNPSGMVVYLMKAIQELEAEVAALKAS